MKNEATPKASEHAQIRQLDQTIRHLQHLRKDLDLALEVQWERPPGLVDPDDPGIRSRGGHSDPTGDSATHPGRLALRKAVQKVERGLPGIEAKAWNMAVALGAPLRAYRGE